MPAPHTISTATTPGFVDPVHDSQRTFRAVLDAMARPGRVRRVTETPGTPPPLSPALAALLLTLADLDTPLWTPEPLPEHAETWLRFHCGCPLVGSTDQAVFALVPNASHIPDLTDLQHGTAEHPDASATLLLGVAALGKGPTRLSLSGPGIRGTEELLIDGLDTALSVVTRENQLLFPLGLDIILAAHDTVACLPRSTRVEWNTCM